LWRGGYIEDSRGLPFLPALAVSAKKRFPFPRTKGKFGDGSATQTTEGDSAEHDLRFRGTRDEDAFRLRFTGPGGSIHIVVPIDGTTATGTGRVSAGGNVYIWEMSVRCVNCS
jgi:hypothetical protein